MAEYTLVEVAEQAVKALRYFGRALDTHGRGCFALEYEGVVMVVARGKSAGRLRRAIEEDRVMGVEMKLDHPDALRVQAADEQLGIV